jgi:hypothetical protein
MTDYLADVRKYDASADEAVVGKIVKHLGIANSTAWSRAGAARSSA